MEDRNIIAIEIGSSKIKGALGTFSSSGILTVHAVEEESHEDWVRYGAVSNVEEVAALVAKIIRKIENRISPRKVAAVYLALGGRSFCSEPKEIEHRFPEETEITEEIIARLIAEAEATPRFDHEILKVIPRRFVVDKTAVGRPKGTVGRSIRMSANLISCRQQLRRNLDRIFGEKLSLPVAGYFVRQLAIADTVLSADERALGCMLVDFGAETTTVSIYRDGTLQYMATIPLGSRNITRDIQQLNFLPEQAENIKRTVGNAFGQTPVIPGEIDYSEVNKHVSYRVGEIIANIRKQLDYAEMKPEMLPAGIVIVGGGSRLTDFNDRLAKTSRMKVKVGAVNLPEIRWSDSRISPTDACDVISTLYAAARSGAQECLTVPEIVETPVEQPVFEPSQPEPEEVVEETVEIAEEELPKKEKKKGPSWFDKLHKIVVSIVQENEDDELQDDE